MDYWSDFGEIHSSSYAPSQNFLPMLRYEFSSYHRRTPEIIIKEIAAIAQNAHIHEIFTLPQGLNEEDTAYVLRLLADSNIISLQGNICIKFGFRPVRFMKSPRYVIYSDLQMYVAISRNCQRIIRFEGLRDVLWAIPDINYISGVRVNYSELDSLK